MKCTPKAIATFVILIATAISLSTNLSAQVRPYNDECSEAIQIPVAPETSFNEFSLEGAQRSNFVVTSTCGNDQEARDVWFSAMMPTNGKLRIEVSATKECPALTLYSGGCAGLGYLACDASKTQDQKKVIHLIDADLAGKKIFIRVHQEMQRAENTFGIKIESIATQEVAVHSLEAQPEGRSVTLNWQTFGELEVNYSLIQHSSDNINFQNIQSIEGRNNYDLEHYTFKHNTPQFGTNYYRIVMIMDDGEAIVHDQIEVIVEKFNAMVRVFPNPTTDGVYLEMPAWIEAASANITLLDMAGKKIIDLPIWLNPSEEIYLDFTEQKFSNGNYLIQIVQKEEMILNSQLSIQ